MTLEEVLRLNISRAKACVPPGIDTLSQYQQLLWKETVLKAVWFIALETIQRRREVVRPQASQIIGDLNPGVRSGSRARGSLL